MDLSGGDGAEEALEGGGDDEVGAHRHQTQADGKDGAEIGEPDVEDGQVPRHLGEESCLHPLLPPVGEGDRKGLTSKRTCMDMRAM